MSAIKKVSREDIVNAACALVRKSGMAALNARALAGVLGCSTRPIYFTFENMDDVKGEVVRRIDEVYGGYLKAEIASGRYPPFKAYGMGYIRFAKEERQFFIYKFMRNRTSERIDDDGLKEVIEVIKSVTGLDEESARLFHLENWIFVHGIAAMFATSYIDFDEELISAMLTDVFEGLKAQYKSKGRSE